MASDEATIGLLRGRIQHGVTLPSAIAKLLVLPVSACSLDADMLGMAIARPGEWGIAVLPYCARRSSSCCTGSLFSTTKLERTQPAEQQRWPFTTG